MRLYFDEDSIEHLLIRLLRNDGHDVELPTDSKLLGHPDAVQLTYAVQNSRVLVSRNHDDFADLHVLIDATGGTHPGILIVCRENNPRRDMTSHGIVRALKYLLASGTQVRNQLIVLNQWR
jgi:Domain of unknown function (DUF5615)